MTDDLLAEPMRISAHHDLPFAIVCYPPGEEMAARKVIRLAAARVNQSGVRAVHFISLSRLFWEGLEAAGGSKSLIAHETQWGGKRLEERTFRMLSSPKFADLEGRVGEALAPLDPARDVAFFVRAGIFAPGFYRISTLLEGLYRKTMVPSILFYPGSYEGGNALRYMNLPGESHLASPQYRVNIYGNEP